MRLAFVKCHGSGNDFLLIDAREVAIEEAVLPGVARALADRAGSVGGDGLLLLTAGDGDHAFGFRMFNPDGSEAETCLNGLRCAARLGFDRLGIDRAKVKLPTSSATVALDPALAPGVVTIREVAGPAGRDPALWPADLTQLPSERAFTALAMPNPHLVTFVDQIDEGELVMLGGVCEAAPDWLPNRANVSFVQVLATGERPEMFVRTFERGVGLTDSCGSAMAASSLAACLAGQIEFGCEIVVRNRGGLVLAAARADGMVRLSGNATFAWRGSAEVDPAAGRASDVRVDETYPHEIAAWARAVGG